MYTTKSKNYRPLDQFYSQEQKKNKKKRTLIYEVDELSRQKPNHLLGPYKGFK